MTDNKNVKVDIIEILNNAKGLDNIKLFCEEVTQKNVTIIKMTDIINLLNSQKAEIETLQFSVQQLSGFLESAKSTTINDFAERLIMVINSFVRETVGDNK